MVFEGEHDEFHVNGDVRYWLFGGIVMIGFLV